MCVGFFQYRMVLPTTSTVGVFTTRNYFGYSGSAFAIQDTSKRIKNINVKVFSNKNNKINVMSCL